MGFSTTVALLAVGHALVGCLAARRATSLPATFAAALAASGASTVVLVIIWGRQAAWFDLFALAHVGYLSLVITIPTMAAAGVIAARRSDRPHLRSRAAGIALSAGLLPAALGLYATHVEPRWLATDRHTIEVASSDGMSDIRIAVMADVQNTRIAAHERNALQRVADADPDILLVAGDLWSQGLPGDEKPRFTEYLRAMTEAAPVVVVVEGDSDNLRGLSALAEGTAVHVLGDETLDVEVRGRPVRIAGTTLRERPATGAMRAAIDQLQQAPDDTFTILLSHRPDAVFDLTAPVDLVVAGHTHGGQIAIPGFGPPFTLSTVPRSVAGGGLHDMDGQAIYVSTGVGMERSHAPQVRFGVRPSVGIIDVVAVPGAT